MNYYLKTLLSDATLSMGKTEKAGSPMRGGTSHFDFLMSLLVTMASLGLALVFLWAASRLAGVDTFEHLPDWFRSGYGALFTAIVSGGSLLAVLIRTIRSGIGPNYLIWIVVLAIGFCLFIVLLSNAFKPHERLVAAPTPAPIPTSSPALAPYKPTLHKEDDKGNPYVAYYDAAGNCLGAVQDKDHLCSFRRTQKQIGGSHDYFDHWEMRFRTPGPPYEPVYCQTGDYEINEVAGDKNGRIENGWAVCSGWINHGADTVHMTVHYQMLW